MHTHIRVYEDQAMLIQSHWIQVALQGQFSHHNDPIISKLTAEFQVFNVHSQQMYLSFFVYLNHHHCPTSVMYQSLSIIHVHNSYAVLPVQTVLFFKAVISHKFQKKMLVYSYTNLCTITGTWVLKSPLGGADEKYKLCLSCRTLRGNTVLAFTNMFCCGGFTIQVCKKDKPLPPI